ncbi:hypothetical protein [Luteibacter sp. E-22]|uniref:hypothetical protein n=1 Tax=Luteibacter sp. E-22 TaxID=3404050 RepID=UPI003CEA2063
MTIDWTAIGGVVGMMLTGLLTWLTTRSKRDVSSAQDQAQISDYRADSALSDAQAKQIKALLDRVESLEAKYTKLWDDLQAEKQVTAKSRDRVRLLESVLRDNNIEIPPEVASP